MKKTVGKGLRLLGLIALLISMTAGLAVAETAAVSLPVRQSFTSNVSGADDTFAYVLTAITENAPMPDGSVNGKYAFSLSGSSGRTLCLSTQQQGYYEYTLRQVVSEEKQNYTYDTTAYHIGVSIRGSEGADGLTSIVVIEKTDGTKTDELQFANAYAKKSSDGGSVKTGDDGSLNAYLIATGVSGGALILLLLWAAANRKKKGVAGREK